MGDIVHGIDPEDDSFGRPEKTGVARLPASLAPAMRVARGGHLCDGLYESLSEQRGSAS
jgi:hypothetical protein